MASSVFRLTAAAAGLGVLGWSIHQGEARSRAEPVLPSMSWEPTEGLPSLSLTGTPGAVAALTFRITLGDLDFEWSETAPLGEAGAVSWPLSVPAEAYLHGDAERYFTWLYVQGEVDGLPVVAPESALAWEGGAAAPPRWWSATEMAERAPHGTWLPELAEGLAPGQILLSNATDPAAWPAGVPGDTGGAR
jgi:hypothetical protein